MTSATALYNASVAAFAVSAADELGLMAELRDGDKVDVDAFAADNGLHPGSVRALAEPLADAGVVDVLAATPLVVTRGPDFDDVWRNKGYLHWLLRGYGDMLGRAADFCRPEYRDRVDVLRERDGGAIARAGRDYGGHFVDPVVTEVLDGLEFGTAIDLGCGSANRVIRLAARYPDRRFIGVDVDAGAVEVARAAVAEAGVGDRVSIVHDDVRALRERPEYPEADLALSFFLGHDFWPRQSCLDTLELVRRRLPRVRHFLFSDTFRSPGAVSAPVFTLGFELTHALMGQHVPTRAEWIDLFEDSVWRLREGNPLGIAHSEIFHLVPRTDGR